MKESLRQQIERELEWILKTDCKSLRWAYTQKGHLEVWDNKCECDDCFRAHGILDREQFESSETNESKEQTFANRVVEAVNNSLDQAFPDGIPQITVNFDES